MNNSAEKGNGGAIFFNSIPESSHAFKLTGSHIVNNVAKLGGTTCNKIRTLLIFSSRRALLRMQWEGRRMLSKRHCLSLHGSDECKVLGK